MGGLEDPEALPLLLNALDDPSATVRESAAEALGGLGDDAATGSLLAALNDESVDVRAAAAGALGDVGDARAAPALLQGLDDLHPEVRKASAEALGALGDAAAVDPLIGALDDPNAGVREAAAGSLGELGDASAVSALTIALRDGEADVREAAAESLGQLDDRRAIAPLSRALEDPSPDVRRSAAIALGAIGDRRAVEPLIDALDDREALVRQAAANALGAIADPRAADALTEALDDPDGGVQHAAALALGALGDDRGIAALAEELRSPDADTREGAAEALGSIGGEDALGALAGAALDPNPDVRETAADFLSAFPNDEAVGSLTDLLGDVDEGVRETAAESLGELGSSEAVPELVDALQTDGDAVQAAAADALGEIGDVTSVEALAGALSDASPEVQAAAAEALGEIGDASAVDDLLQALESGSSETAAAAAGALEQITGLDGGWDGLSQLENGALVSTASGLGLVAGTTTGQAARGPAVPVFDVTGAEHTGYLRTTTGDAYEGGVWRSVEPVPLDYAPPAQVSSTTAAFLASPVGEAARLLGEGAIDTFVLPPRQAPSSLFEDAILIAAATSGGGLGPGRIPVSRQLKETDAAGQHRPLTATFDVADSTPAFSWRSDVYRFSDAQLNASLVPPGSAYAQLPDDLPQRVRDLALQITASEPTPYGKARAIESYLRTQYTYSYADEDPDPGVAPPGQDPVDWFLFDHPFGTCGQFSSGFVLLARAAGLHARAVSGWAIAQTAGTQTVYSDQAHQWAEVAFEGLGWITFEPTPGGAPERALRSRQADGSGGQGSGDGGSSSGDGSTSGQQPTPTPALTPMPTPPPTPTPTPPPAPPPPSEPQPTVTSLTSAPPSARADTGFVVQGSVVTEDGDDVWGMAVEVRLHTQVGEGQTVVGRGEANGGSVSLLGVPGAGFAPGQYFVLLHAVGDDRYAESWSQTQTITILAPLAPPTPAPPVPAPPPDTPPAPGLVDTVTEITELPARVRKGFPATVSGTVRTVAGVAVDGVPVEIFLNTSKAPGGTKVGAGAAVQGGFDIEFEVPADFEVGSYQVLAHALATPGFRDSWSDPEIGVFTGTAIELQGPVTTPVDEPVTYSGRLLEEAGVAVSGQLLEVRRDGSPVSIVTTDDAGAFSFGQVFQDSGPHVIEVELRETEVLLGNIARLDVQATLPVRLTLDVPSRVDVDSQLDIAGVLVTSRGDPVGGRPLQVRIDAADPVAVFTGPDGRFTLPSRFADPGRHTIAVEFEGDDPLLPISREAVIEAWVPTVLELDGPPDVRLGGQADFAGRLTTTAGDALAGTPLTLRVDNADVDTTVTDAGGRFEISRSFNTAGPVAVQAVFPVGEFLEASSSTVSLRVVEPAVLTLDGLEPSVVGQSWQLSGALTGASGRAIPGEPIVVLVDGAERARVTTDEAGRFAWPTIFFEEGPVTLAARFDGGPTLSAAEAVAAIEPAIAALVLDDVEPVARGGALDVSGVLRLGSQGVPNALVSGSLAAGPPVEATTDERGAFTMTFPVAADAPRGLAALGVAAPGLDVSAGADVRVMSLTRLSVAPVGSVKSGKPATLEVTLLDDTGAGVAGAAIAAERGGAALTDASGIATLTIEPPPDEEPASFPVSVRFDGDDAYLPASATLGLPFSSGGGGSALPWILIPVLMAVAARGGFLAARRLLVPAAVVVAAAQARDNAPELARVAPVPEHVPPPPPVETALALRLSKPAEDLPEVWGIGETMRVTCGLSKAEGGVVSNAAVALSGPGLASPLTSQTDGAGACGFELPVNAAGEFEVTARFEGDAAHLPSRDAKKYRVVQFVDEVMRLYNDFLAWGRRNASGIEPDATPRRVEWLLMSQGMVADDKALEDVIRLFEEARYSEHEIGRPHYERMFRACHSLMKERAHA